MVAILASRAFLCEIIDRNLVQVASFMCIFRLEMIALVGIFVLVLSIHPLLSWLVSTHLLSFYIISFVSVVGIVLSFFIASSAVSSMAVFITIFMVRALGIGRIVGIFPLGGGTIIVSSVVMFLFVGGLMRFLVFFHDGEHSLVHPVLFVVEGERRVRCVFVHFSIKIMLANKLKIKIIALKL